MNKKPWLTIIGIGDDGWNGLTNRQQDIIANAQYIFGGKRHLGFLPVELTGELRAWPSPFSRAIDEVLLLKGNNVVILASGDPMFFGFGATLLRQLPVDDVAVLPHPSSFSLAAARLGWALQDVVCLSVHGRPIRAIVGHLQPKKRLIILSEDARSPAFIAQLLQDEGFGASRLTIMEHLDAAKERVRCQIANEFSINDCENLNLVAVDCVGDNAMVGYSRYAALPDNVFSNDGQLTKQDIRAVVMAHLAPKYGEVLWDVGAGCGSISIEWLRGATGTRAYAIEKNEKRQQLILKNSLHLGTFGLQLVRGEAPSVLAGLEKPDAIFIGGGFTYPEVFESCWAQLKPGGRLVVNAVTVETEALLQACATKIAARLLHLAVAEAAPLGNFRVWRNALPITMMIAIKQ
ncbi:precorrin-6y C5,15-methyltransferase (decarboxylating) subunit CbiE [uncultured Bartonella sp.]|uniref:precorrin-6y C5,15-methyltransferase (decarboxylating) subunit CbiE n=1 Tax=uncultured Bartonella sp. TaxID=104108 RepID=UPI00260F6208|nr:precorrin-6y C5,15-methyltransferase (decarboxylating) subunit CbiE [uncultured Bartonella sp.]